MYAFFMLSELCMHFLILGVIWELCMEFFYKTGSIYKRLLPCYWNFGMNLYAGNLNECPFTAEMSIYFRFSKNGHSLCQKK
jgi:hypothetical protein